LLSEPIPGGVQGVAQLGKRAAFGTLRPVVRVHSPRPFISPIFFLYESTIVDLSVQYAEPLSLSLTLNISPRLDENSLRSNNLSYC
jgi:hypothetical protein